MRNVLVIDDDDAFRLNLCMGLNLENYATFESPSGEHGLEQFNQINPDMVLLDFDLPGMNGLEVLQNIKQRSDTPVIMISGNYTQEDVRLSYKEDAHDFLFKPFTIDELVGKIKKIEQKNSKPAKSHIIKANEIEINTTTQTVFIRKEFVSLTKYEYRLLKLLVEHKGKLLENEFILTGVWGENHAEDNEYLKNYIRHLRVKIEEKPSEPKLILNEHGRGYRLKTN